ncbi:hypothetical protein [Methanocaldococcus sp.]
MSEKRKIFQFVFILAGMNFFYAIISKNLSYLIYFIFSLFVAYFSIYPEEAEVLAKKFKFFHSGSKRATETSHVAIENEQIHQQGEYKKEIGQGTAERVVNPFANKIR